MNLSKVTVILPNRNEIFARLRRLAGNTAELNKFYMRLFKHAGLEYSVSDLVTVVINEIADHTINMTAIDMDILVGEAPHFIDALASDHVFASAAKDEFQKRMATA